MSDELTSRAVESRYSEAQVLRAFRAWVALANACLRAGVGELDGRVEGVRIDPDKACAAFLADLKGGQP